MRLRRGYGAGKFIPGIHAMDAGDVHHFRWVGLCMVALGSLLALGFGAVAAEALAFRARTIGVEARVTGFHEWEQERAPSFFSPLYELTLPDGRRVEVRGLSETRRCCEPGAVRRVRVDPERPDVAVLDHGAGDWGTPLLFAGLGLVFVLLGLAGMLVARRGAASLRERMER